VDKNCLSCSQKYILFYAFVEKKKNNTLKESMQTNERTNK